MHLTGPNLHICNQAIWSLEVTIIKWCAPCCKDMYFCNIQTCIVGSQYHLQRQLHRHIYKEIWAKNCDYFLVSTTLCILGTFSCLLTFFKINFFIRTIRVSNSLDPDQDRHCVGLIWVQTVCKCYQLTPQSPLAKELCKSVFKIFIWGGISSDTVGNLVLRLRASGGVKRDFS